MATIARQALEIPPAGTQRWAAIAACIADWARAHDVGLRDAIVLLPFAQLLAPARRAFAQRTGWMPRIETTLTLAASLGPAPAAVPGQVSFDATLDALSAEALLRTQPWGARWARRDPRAFRQATLALVATAHELLRVVVALHPADRAAHWTRAREALPPLAGPGASERLLARVALEWACLAPPPATDRLFALGPPSAWIAVQAGGADALAARLMALAEAPCLVLDTDAAEDEPFSALAPNCEPTFALCDGFEHEAQCAATQVFVHVERGELPVALIAQDRTLVRRVRALLEREGVPLLDETGWTLSTTRAAAQVMALLRAAQPDASTDALLDWLKAGTVWARADGGVALTALEAGCRRGQWARRAALDAGPLEPPAARLWAAACAVLNGLTTSQRRPLAAWLVALATALDGCGTLASLRDDDAGRQLIAALRLAPRGLTASAWTVAAGEATMGLDEFRAWVDGVLEQAIFLPTARSDRPAQVIITPLARAVLRPFAAIVFPGTDDRHLGAQAASASLLGDAQAGALGVPTKAQRRATEALAFVQLLAVPQITLLRRRVDAAEPLSDSPLVERLALTLGRQGRALAGWRDPRIECDPVATPIRMSAPSAPGLLPQRLSASACEALRACPYRFFALHMLRLREDDELEREIEKRDYGSWLHAVLFEFHRSRAAPAAAAIEIARLAGLARASQVRQGIADADFLPFAASFSSFAPRYVAWLHERDAQGARWLRGEDAVSARPDGLQGIELHGVVDRIDALGDEAGRALQLIDYKTGSAHSLKEKVKQPLEDTQLAFYAALVRSQTELPLQAMYLALDGSKGLERVEHRSVETSAAALVEGLAHDLRRLRAGVGLPALGVGATCDYCAARGICRRDHWTDR